MFPSCLCILQNLHLLQLFSGLFTLAASKASAGTSAFCILITDHITVPEWPKQSLIRVMKGWLPAQQSRNVEVIILILCILAGFFFGQHQSQTEVTSYLCRSSKHPVDLCLTHMRLQHFLLYLNDFHSTQSSTGIRTLTSSDLIPVLYIRSLESPNICSNIYIYRSAVYVPVYRLQAPQGRSSRSRT